MLVAFGVVNRAFGGSWLFLEPSIRFGLTIRRAMNPWRSSRVDVSHAVWLSLPFYAALGAVVCLVVRRRLASSFERAAQASLLVLGLTWAMSDAIADTAFLQYFYYTSYLAPLALIALPLQGGPPPGARSLRSAVLIELATLATLAILTTPRLRTNPALYLSVASVTTISGLVAVFGLQFIRQSYVRWAVFVTCLAISCSVLPQFWRDRSLNSRADFGATAEAHRFIATNVAGRTMRIWYASPTSTSPPYRSIACAYLCTKLFVNEDLPRLTRQDALAIKPAMRLVLLVNRESEADEARASLPVVGLDYAVIARQQFGPGDRRFFVIVADVVPAPPQV